ncbi:hypothetical protein DYB34_013067 [Aphanomyces astaci]|uniref:Uncharacterized protein n=1 Tax=Aphanomyces astaci TaxID=112090 RepID=A0A3R6XCK3_APHAT|nr:hypothetical protein DYB34_013067 [Aphanomyces astaci]
MPLDLQSIKSVIEASIEDLVRVADTKINWNNAASTSASKKGYVYLPGVYVWEADKSSTAQPTPRASIYPLNDDHDDHDSGGVIDHFPKPPTSSLPDDAPPDDEGVADCVPPVEDADGTPLSPDLSTPCPTPHPPVVDNSVAAFLMNDDDIASIGYTLVLHGDNTFEYVWKQKKTGTRPMEHKVELTGRWHTPVLNRDRYGERDQRVFLDTARARFQRVANYGTTLFDSRKDHTIVCLHARGEKGIFIYGAWLIYNVGGR